MSSDVALHGGDAVVDALLAVVRAALELGYLGEQERVVDARSAVLSPLLFRSLVTLLRELELRLSEHARQMTN